MRNREETFIDKSTARNLWVVCGFFFLLFSFVYLYVFQRDVITALHYALAHGKTVYSPLAGAIVLTIVLWMFQWGINMFLRFKGLLGAISYFPSFLFLGILTDINYSVGCGEAINSIWGWLLPLFLLLFIGFSILLRTVFKELLNPPNISTLKLFYSNLTILAIGAIMTISIGNSNVNFHHELAIESAIKHKDWSEARNVGIKSLESTRTLTALRAFALSQEGVLGDYLFSYPQEYKSDGLLLDKSSQNTIYYKADSIYAYLGVYPQSYESTAAYLNRAYTNDEGCYTLKDYYLCSLLLDKDLETFAKELELVV
ncbi:MAG: DUF6057 family protein, partial [Phocaeicola sp.]